ncbi:Lrp/AsnC family transcriptional regulator [Paraburkholderia caribensis]|uniref:Lrp/AsnC family transcriptional regulator n=1 Tax=Paraburkholderia caribensis TaxID=75105 RepID=UPI000721C821|nr:Lrp/AsnC family transcriptional regulator [Paraburkholderia caribensis]ALP68495.1 ArsR family transcriptional regulator [Paraburkholderia caribensis]AUT57849.1 Lrp/AsnC family transcriptional regulator [Paraburkholderia caribensis]
MLDKIDKQLLAHIQEDSSRSVSDIAQAIPLSTTPCWRRLQRLQKDGYIRKQVALLDANLLNLAVTVFVEIRVPAHSPSWLAKFSEFTRSSNEIVEVYRLSGHADYLLKAVVPDVAAFDSLYKLLIARLDLADVRSAFAMETIKCTTALPLDYADR